MDGSLDFLGNVDSIALGQTGFSSPLDEYGDIDQNFEVTKIGQSGSILSTINLDDIGHFVTKQCGNLDSVSLHTMELSDIATTFTGSSESTSGGLCLSPANSMSPGTSVGTGSSPINLPHERNPTSGSADQIASLPLDDLDFGFGDEDIEKMANNIMFDGDDVLDSSFFNDGMDAVNEPASIQLDDTLISRDSENTLHNPRSQLVPSTTVSITDSLNANNVISVIDVESTNNIRCTLPNFKPLILTDEEKKLLEQEKVFLPTDLPLTKSEERVLKRVRRKIRNKKSALESRRRKKDYVGGLESRVTQCTMQNNELVTKVKDLESQNKSLLMQLKKLQNVVRSFSGIASRTTQASTCVLVLLLCFGLFLAPNYGPLSFIEEGVQQDSDDSSIVCETHKSRRILEVGTVPHRIQHSHVNAVSQEDLKVEMKNVLRNYDKPEVPDDPSDEVKQEPAHFYTETKSARQGVSWKSDSDNVVTEQELLPMSAKGEGRSTKNVSDVKNINNGMNRPLQKMGDKTEEFEETHLLYSKRWFRNVVAKNDMQSPALQPKLGEEQVAAAEANVPNGVHSSEFDES